MYQVGDKILYGSNGACIIQELTQMRFGRTRELYYILRPMFQKTAVIYVPAKNEELILRMRPMPEKQEVDAMIKDLPDADEIWLDDAQERKNHYDEIMRDSDCFLHFRLIKTLFEHKKVRLADGKNLHVSDENFLREARKLICDEFAYPLQLEPAEVADYITKQLGFNLF